MPTAGPSPPRRSSPLVRRASRRAAWFLPVFYLAAASFAQAPRVSGASSRLAQEIGRLLDHPDVRQTHWGVSFVSLKDGRELAGWNQHRLFVPASTVKLFPAAAALSLLGPEFRYSTTVETHSVVTGGSESAGQKDSETESGRTTELQGDLVLVGRGDPNLSGRELPLSAETERALTPQRIFQQLAATVAARGIRSVAGDLIADDRYFVHEPVGEGWEHDDLMWRSGAPVSALAINDNVMYLSVFPGALGRPPRLEIEPLAGYYEIGNQAVTAGRGSARGLGLERVPGSLRLRLWGEIPQGAPESSYAISIEEPPRFAAEYLRQELARAGVEVKGKIVVLRREASNAGNLAGTPRRQGDPPQQVYDPEASAGPASVLARHESAPLAESLKVILKASQNLHAEMLLRTLGREQRGVGSAEAGIAAIDDFLSERGVPKGSVILRDGSGLSRQNLVTPAGMTALLKAVYQSEQGAAWTAMLSEAGVDGTLRNRLRGRYTTARVWAKTGNLSGVAALAGYVANQSDDLIAFAIFANNYDSNEGSVISIMDQIVTLVARSR